MRFSLNAKAVLRKISSAAVIILLSVGATKLTTVADSTAVDAVVTASTPAIHQVALRATCKALYKGVSVEEVATVDPDCATVLEEAADV